MDYEGDVAVRWLAHRFHAFNTSEGLGVHSHACWLTGSSILALHVDFTVCG